MVYWTGEVTSANVSLLSLRAAVAEQQQQREQQKQQQQQQQEEQSGGCRKSVSWSDLAGPLSAAPAPSEGEVRTRSLDMEMEREGGGRQGGSHKGGRRSPFEAALTAKGIAYRKNKARGSKSGKRNVNFTYSKRTKILCFVSSAALRCHPVPRGRRRLPPSPLPRQDPLL